MIKLKRGDVVYSLPHGDRLGGGGYPVVIMSDGDLSFNRRVNAVQLSLFPRSLLPTDVVVEATGTPSVARCGVIQSLPVEWIGDYIGECTEEELADISNAVAHALGLNKYGY